MTIRTPRQSHRQQSSPSQTYPTSSAANHQGILLRSKKQLHAFPPPSAPEAPQDDYDFDCSPPSGSPTPSETTEIDDLEATLASLSLRPHPYECTRGCGDTFPSPSPWKRHENAAHPNPEVWRCDLPTTTSAACSHISYSPDSFVAHISSVHGIPEDDVPGAYCEERRIGGGYQGNFWCGFCAVRVGLRERGQDALDERFGHLIRHFIEGKRVVNDWIALKIPL